MDSGASARNPSIGTGVTGLVSMDLGSSIRDLVLDARDPKTSIGVFVFKRKVPSQALIPSYIFGK